MAGKLTKVQRAELYGMFDGRCAYCGCELSQRWHADHVEPVIRLGGSKMLHPERDTPENYVPSCAPCNIDKHRMTVEAWREWLSVRLGALKNGIYILRKPIPLDPKRSCDMTVKWGRTGTIGPLWGDTLCVKPLSTQSFTK